MRGTGRPEGRPLPSVRSDVVAAGRLARHYHPLRAQGQPGRRRRRRPGQPGQHGYQEQREEGAPPWRRLHPGRLRRQHRRRLYPAGAARGQARAAPGPARPRLRRARQGLADRPLPAPARGDDGSGRPRRLAGADRQRRRAGARGRAGRHRLRRALRALCRPRAGRHRRHGRPRDRREGDADRRRDLRLHQREPLDRDPGILMTALTPREIVSELDRFIVGQQAAKRAVAIALRNRWRRLQIDEALREEVVPKNILMIGPTGCGKTEIARRLARLANAPFLKVEATKFTEVGYVGRDVESIVRDLVEVSQKLTRDRLRREVRAQAEANAEERLLDALVGTSAGRETREAFRRRVRDGQLADREVEIEVQDTAGASLPTFDIPGVPGAQMGMVNLGEMLGKAFGPKQKRKKVTVAQALELLLAEEGDKLLDQERVNREALQAAEQNGIVFIDEIDKISAREGRVGADVSREGVQRDLLPLIEGTTVATKHGSVKTDHILFIASGAFHAAKPSDLLPELQGRLPIRVELKALTRDDFERILTEPEASLIKQYTALLGTENVTLDFTADSVSAIADIAAQVNATVENIGARRLHTVMERIVDEISFAATDRAGETLTIDAAYVHARVDGLAKDQDLSRFIL